MELPHSLGESVVECPACQGMNWTIFQHRVKCSRCGLCYSTPHICNIPTMLMQETMPSKEVLAAMKIFDGHNDLNS